MDTTSIRARLLSALPLIALDATGVVLALAAALVFRFDGQIPEQALRSAFGALPFTIFAYLLVNGLFGLYRRLWRYASPQEVLTIGAATVITTLGLIGVGLLWSGQRPIPLSVVALNGMFALAAFVAARYRRRLITGMIGHLQHIVGSPERQRVLIIGAGEAGNLFARQLQLADSVHRYELVGFIDDDQAKHGMRVRGALVVGGRNAIPLVVAERGVELIIIAIHTIDGLSLREILSICLTTRARVKIVPDFMHSIDQATGVLPLRDIAEEDLLGRQLTMIDEAACRAMIADRVALVTGAAGSIGSELCAQILALGPRMLLMLDNNETGLHELCLFLRCHEHPQLVSIVADISDRARMESIFASYRPQVVFHAAAYKHVPMMEHHPAEAVRINVLGTRNVIELARRYPVERFVFISTDKAVAPSSVMGATKRVGELMIMASAGHPAASDRHPLFTAVRFGNVLGSRGSVAPRLIRQIEQGGPVTITHPEMTRYFISVSEAVSLVIQAATLTRGGDMFILDMGQPIRIEDLARKMIRLRGLRPDDDVPIVYTGVRPGEKLHEELFAPGEERAPTDHPKIYRIFSPFVIDDADLSRYVDRIINCARRQRIEDLNAALWDLIGHELEVGRYNHGASASATPE